MAIKKIGLSIAIDAKKAIIGSARVNTALSTIRKNARLTAIGMRKGFVGLGKVLFSLKAAFLGLGVALIAKSFLNAAKTAEGFRIRLNALLGSVKEGNRAFEEMAEFAGKVPFEFREIMEASTRLSGVVKGGVDEIKGLMPVIADLSAATGIALDETTGQLIRMLSAGASAADMFRERGVLSMLGFQSGVRYSVEETKKILMEAWNDPQSKFKDVSKDLAKSWTGLMSMLSDKWFIFRLMLMDAAPFEYLRAAFGFLNRTLGDTVEEQKKFAEAMGKSIIDLAKKTILGISNILDIVIPIITSIGKQLQRLWEGFRRLPPFVQQVGIVGAFAFGMKGKLALAALTGFSIIDKKLSQYDAHGRALIGIFNIAGQKIRDLFKDEDPIMEFKVDKRSLLGEKKELSQPVKVESIFTAQESAVDSYTKKVQEVIAALDDMVVKEREIAEKEALREKFFPTKKVEDFFTQLKIGTNKGLDNYAKKINEVMKQSEKLVIDSFGRMEDALVNFVMTGKINFNDFAKSIIADMARIAIRKAILAPLLGAFGIGGTATKATGAVAKATGAVAKATLITKVTAAAKGIIIQKPKQLAKGDILHKPTLLAGGSAIAGEAGDEGVLPLSRMRNGDLGVQMKGRGGGNTIVIHNNVTVEDTGGGTTEDKAETAEMISKQIEFMINTKVVSILRDQTRPGGMLKEEFAV